MLHLANLDVSCYDREYAPAAERAAAKRAHIALWPDAIDMTIQTLDAVTAPVAQSLLGAFAGLAAGIDNEAALAAHARLMVHLQEAADNGSPDAALGATSLAALIGTVEASEVDVGRLAGLATVNATA